MSLTTTNIYRGISTASNEKAKPLENRSVDDRQYIPKQFQEVAESMESQFAEAMLNQMNNTIGENSADSAMDFYKSLQTSDRAKTMAKQNNLGLQTLILDQIYPKRLRNEMALKQYEAQANVIHQNLPSYKLEKKNDTIGMGKNDSTPLSGEKMNPDKTREGGLP